MPGATVGSSPRILADIFCLALGAVFFVAATRVTMYVFARPLLEKKPWKCDLCMSFHGAWSFATFVAGVGLGPVDLLELFLTIPAAAGATLVVLTYLRAATGLPGGPSVLDP